MEFKLDFTYNPPEPNTNKIIVYIPDGTIIHREDELKYKDVADVFEKVIEKIGSVKVYKMGNFITRDELLILPGQHSNHHNHPVA